MKNFRIIHVFRGPKAGFHKNLASLAPCHQFLPTNSLTFLDTKTLHQDTVLKPSYGSYLLKHLYMTQIVIVTAESNQGTVISR